jgi:hypothetical protein
MLPHLSDSVVNLTMGQVLCEYVPLNGGRQIAVASPDSLGQAVVVGAAQGATGPQVNLAGRG